MFLVARKNILEMIDVSIAWFATMIAIDGCTIIKTFIVVLLDLIEDVSKTFPIKNSFSSRIIVTF